MRICLPQGSPPFCSLRTLHDAILVGVGTVLNDNPRLNGEHTAQASASVALAHASVILSARLLPNPPPAEKQPQPIVLDTHLRTPPDARLLTNYKAGGGRQPIILCSQTKAKEELRSALEAAGALVVPLPSMGWPHILDALGSQVGVQRLMVEGGAKVIETLLTAADSDGNGRPGDLIDSLIITVSPNFAGSDATGYKSPRWRDVVVQTGKASVAPKAGEKGKEGAPFHVCKKAWFGDDAVWMWKRGEKET